MVGRRLCRIPYLALQCASTTLRAKIWTELAHARDHMVAFTQSEQGTKALRHCTSSRVCRGWLRDSYNPGQQDADVQVRTPLATSSCALQDTFPRIFAHRAKALQPEVVLGPLADHAPSRTALVEEGLHKCVENEL